MLDERKAAILKAVVEEYIETAQPVGSASVVRATDLLVSTATVRHELAHLEREGFLDHPHTSAGRVPTDKGYRFFVDHLTPSLGDSQRHTVRTSSPGPTARSSRCCTTRPGCSPTSPTTPPWS